VKKFQARNLILVTFLVAQLANAQQVYQTSFTPEIIVENAEPVALSAEDIESALPLLIKRYQLAEHAARQAGDVEAADLLAVSLEEINKEPKKDRSFWQKVGSGALVPLRLTGKLVRGSAALAGKSMVVIGLGLFEYGFLGPAGAFEGLFLTAVAEDKDFKTINERLSKDRTDSKAKASQGLALIPTVVVGFIPWVGSSVLYLGGISNCHMAYMAGSDVLDDCIFYGERRLHPFEDTKRGGRRIGYATARAIRWLVTLGQY